MQAGRGKEGETRVSEAVSDDELKRHYREEHNDRVRDMEKILRTPEGKRYFWYLLETCHMFTSTFTGNSTGNFMEGERNVGLRVFNDVLKVDPKLMGQMAQSHAAKRKLIMDKKAAALKRAQYGRDNRNRFRSNKRPPEESWPDAPFGHRPRYSWGQP